MAAPPLKKQGISAACLLLLACTACLSSRFNTSAAFERPIHFSVLALVESGLLIAAWSRWQSPSRGSRYQGFEKLANLASSKPDWQRGFQVAVDAVRTTRFRLSRPVLLRCAIVLRSLLFWRTVQMISCSWESFETFLPALIALYTAVYPDAIEQQWMTGEKNRSRRRPEPGFVRYLVVAILWGCAARTTLALSTQSVGTVCPPGFFRWERQIPLAQALIVGLDALLLVNLSKWRKEATEDTPQAWAFASRLFLGSAAVLVALAGFSLTDTGNTRWAFSLHYVEVRDLVLDSSLATIAVLSALYVINYVHPRTLAMITTASWVYANQLIRMTKTAAPVDDSLLYMVSGSLTIAGVGLLLHSEKHISSTSGLSTGDYHLVRTLTRWYVILVGLLGGTYLFFSPDFYPSNSPSFPDLLFMASAKSDAWIAQANHSTTLDNAAKEYRRRYGLPPPPNFDKWFEYAVAQGSPVIDDFSQINDDLLPFWGMPPDILRQRTRYVLELPWLGVGGLRIRKGKVDVVPGTPGTHQWMMEAIQDMIEPFAKHLPDMDVAMNLNDECRVAIPFEEAQELRTNALVSRARLLENRDRKAFNRSRPAAWSDEYSIQKPHVVSPYFSNRIRDEIYYDYVAPACPPDSAARSTRWWNRKDSCRDCLLPHTSRVSQMHHPVVSNWTAATDLCHQPDLAYLHGFLLSPAAAVFSNTPFPIFSQSRTSGFADILIPSPWNFIDKVQYNEVEDVAWEEKKNVMFWRGAATDGYAAWGSWQSFLRARFVAVANLVWEKEKTKKTIPPPPRQQKQKQQVARSDDSSPEFDVGFVGDWTKCHAYDCQTEKDTYWGIGRDKPNKDKVPFTDHWRYAHLMDLDGAGFSGRFIPFLRSKSLVYRTGIFRTWMAERVHSWRHYVPVDVRFHELPGLLRYFGTDQEGRRRAKAIAEEGRMWAGRALRREDMRVYMFRLLLEWGRLVDDGREELGFAA